MNKYAKYGISTWWNITSAKEECNADACHMDGPCKHYAECEKLQAKAPYCVVPFTSRVQESKSPETENRLVCTSGEGGRINGHGVSSDGLMATGCPFYNENVSG